MSLAVGGLESARQELRFSVLAYVFMPEHVHLIVWPHAQDYDISQIRGAIKEPVGRQAIRFLEELSSGWLSRVTRKRGKKIERSFWQSGGGYDRNIDSAAVLQAAIEYIHLNPVRRGLVKFCEDWRWSSAAYFAGGVSPLEPDKIPAEWLE